MAGSGAAHLDTQGALMTARDIVKTYKAKGGRRVQALSGVSFDVKRGETLGVVGESGSGKSTLARAILALPHPDSGSVVFDGHSVLEASGAGMRQLRHNMQMVFQDPLSSLNPSHKILDIVEMPLLVAGKTSAAERRRIVRDTLASVGLDSDVIGQRRPYELSGGQCQRVSLARALVLRPKLLVCDEPVSALDVSVQAQVINLLEDAKAAFDLTMLFISHDLSVVKSISDRVMVMYLGKVCEVAPTDSLYAQPRHPYTATLLASVPSLVPRQRQERPLIARGETPSPLAVPSGCRFRTRCPRAAEQCAEQEPQIRQVGDNAGHFVACHFPLSESQATRQEVASLRCVA